MTEKDRHSCWYCKEFLWDGLDCDLGLAWCLPVVLPHRVTSSAQQHLDRPRDVPGVDIVNDSSPENKTLLAMSNGSVKYIHDYIEGHYDNEKYWTLGLFVVVEHKIGGIPVWVRYAHNERVDARLGKDVEVGQPIGLYGNTGFSRGPHVHIDMWIKEENLSTAELLGLTRRTGMAIRQSWPRGPKDLLAVNPTLMFTETGLITGKRRAVWINRIH